MKKLAIISLMILSFAAPTMPAALAQSGTCPVAGRYMVLGRSPGESGTYTGQAVVSANSTGCHVQWFPPNDSSGTGTYVDGVLTVYFRGASTGASGVVKYTRAANGELHGVWWMNGNESNQGTETLRRM